METLEFSAPVRIRHRGGLIEIQNVEQALRFLDQWPASRRGPVYQCAVNGCSAAITGHLTPEEARRAVMSFAQITGILETKQVKLAG